MRSHRHSELVALAVGVLVGISTRPLAAAVQIARLADDQGRIVYVNAVSVASHVRSQDRKPSLTPALSARKTSSARTYTPPPSLSQSTRVPDAPDLALPFDGLVRQTATRAQVDPDLVHAIIQVESEYNPRAISLKGAMGLMQLVPATVRRFGVGNPFDPAENVQGGVTYLRYLLDLFGGDLPLALAAYNAGENAVLRADGIPPFAETRGYVRKVTALYGGAGGDARRKPTPSAPRPIYSYVD